MSDTIIAQATPAGKSGVAILRISGPKALSIIRHLGISSPLKARYCHYATLLHPDTHQVIDQAIIIFFPCPHSFTGEDVVEIHCHGSRVVIQELLSVILSIQDVRYAESGEFSRRALEQGKMDLVQVEALMDVIDAETSQQKALAMHQLRGEISHHYYLLEARLIEARAFAEVFIDFPDEDLPLDMDEQINQKIDDSITLIEQFLASAKTGCQIREGVQVAIIGVPNAGKSTLLNYLAGKQVAITSAIPGTTRDMIELYKDIDGLPYRFYDTAGIRDSIDEIERQGVHIAEKKALEADITLVLLDGTTDLTNQYAQLSKIVSRETIYIINKSDVRKNDTEIVSRETISISAKTGEGISSLIKTLLEKHYTTSYEKVYITRQRHVSHLSEALFMLLKAKCTIDLVIKSEYLAEACRETGFILGKISVERILDELFSTFCIGK